MSDFTVLILYSGIIYLFTFLMYKDEKKRGVWDKLFLIFAPISIPMLIVYCFFKVVLE